MSNSQQFKAQKIKALMPISTSIPSSVELFDYFEKCCQFTALGCSLPCSHDPATGLRAGPNKFISKTSIPFFKKKLILYFHVCFRLPSGAFPSGSRIKASNKNKTQFQCTVSCGKVLASLEEVLAQTQLLKPWCFRTSRTHSGVEASW